MQTLYTIDSINYHYYHDIDSSGNLAQCILDAFYLTCLFGHHFTKLGKLVTINIHLTSLVLTLAGALGLHGTPVLRSWILVAGLVIIM